jgi:CIC family chloride channel protein
MISNLIAYFISYKLQEEPIYEALAHQDGVHLPSGGAAEPGGRVRVSQAMQPPQEILSPQLQISEAAARVRPHNLDAYPVSNGDGFMGMVRKWELESAIARGRGSDRLADVIGGADKFPHVHPDHSVALALERMGTSGHSVLPVVSRANVRRLEGVVTLEDILEAFGLAHAPEDAGAQ